MGGGTDFLKKSTIGEEKAWESGGGGFSNHFPAPAYQKDAVAKYLQDAQKAGVLPTASKFNSTGRGYPDLAALGGEQNMYCVSVSLIGLLPSMMGIAGTSASCPVVGGVIARINAARAAAGAANMGFLNPFIYMHPEAFNDVQHGVNDGGGSEGFAAIAGWDAATGMGTPNFPKLEAAAMKAAEQAEAIVV